MFDNVDDKDLNLDIENKDLDDKDQDDVDKNLDNEEDKDKGDDTWKDKQKVPYRRLEAQSRKTQQLEKELNDLKNQFNLSNKSENKPSGRWDDKVKNAKSWDEIFNELPDEFIKTLLANPEAQAKLAEAVKGNLKNEEKAVEEKVNREIDELWDKDIITSKEQENRIIKYAIKESEESGEYIPLAVAVRMMKKEGVFEKKLEDRKDANNKVRPGNSSGNNKDIEKSSYSKFRHNSIDNIVFDAASKFSK